MHESIPVSTIERLFAVAERKIGLLDRCRPLNAAPETERVIQAWDAGGVAVPHYEYAAAPLLTTLSGALDTVAGDAAAAGPWGELYAARALELLREVRVVEAIGAAAFPDRARERFPIDDNAFGKFAHAAATAWASLRVEAGERSVLSDDAGDPESLISVMRVLVGERRLAVRVATTSDLPCAAATGDGVILVQTGVWHRPECARRIALHEVLGHALPRQRAKGERLGLFSVGTECGSDDEEGRALVIEERHSLFDAERRRSLAVRHLAALAVRGGADFVEVVRLSMSLGLPPREAVRVAARVHRGGGLAREIIYLTARERVRAAFDSDHRIEALLERGRIGVDAARVLLRLGPAPTHLSATPAERSRLQRNVATTGV